MSSQFYTAIDSITAQGHTSGLNQAYADNDEKSFTMTILGQFFSMTDIRKN